MRPVDADVTDGETISTLRKPKWAQRFRSLCRTTGIGRHREGASRLGATLLIGMNARKQPVSLVNSPHRALHAGSSFVLLGPPHFPRTVIRVLSQGSPACRAGASC